MTMQLLSRRAGLCRTSLQLLLALVAVLMSAAVLAETDRDAQPGGELALAMVSMPPTLNSALTAVPMTTMPAAQIFASLFRLNAQFEPQPYLAERWHLSDDGLSLTVDLVSNARFHDGHPVTSRDVAFSIGAVRDYHSFRDMLKAVDRVETPSPHRAVIRLRHPHPALFLALAAPLTPILPAHIYDDGTPLPTHPANRAPIGSGPFRFVAHEPDDRIVLERFEDYFIPGLPYLERLVFEVYPGARQPVLALKSGDVQLIPIVPMSNLDRVLSVRPDLIATREGMSGLSHVMVGVALNLRRPPFDDPRVRRALALALDLKRFSQVVLRPGVSLATGPLPREHRFANGAAAPLTPDLKLANRLLDEAGYPRAADGRRLSVEYLSVVEFPSYKPIGDYLRAQLGSKLGVEISGLRDVSLSEWQRLMAAGEFDLSLEHRLVWGDPLLGVHRTYHSDAIRPDGIFTNYSGYASPEADGLLDAAAAEPDPAKRRSLYARFQARIAEDLPIIWLSEIPVSIVHDADLVFPTDSPWAIVQPYDRVHWRSPESGTQAPSAR